MPRYEKYKHESPGEAKKRIAKNKAKDMIKKLKKKRKKKNGSYGDNHSHAIGQE